MPRQALLALLFAVAACGSSESDPPGASGAAGGGGGGGTSAAPCAAVPRTCDEVLATFISGNDANVSVTCDEAKGTFTVSSTGLPAWDPEALGEGTPNTAMPQNWVATFPLNPACAAATTNVVSSRGQIGFAVDGVPFYGPENAQGADAYQTESHTFDSCGGHADMGGHYHYHAEPVCVFGLNTPTDSVLADDGHGAVIGYMRDGFAIHASTRLPDEPPLDMCNGHTTKTRGYHYHATDIDFPYLVACYAGEPTGTVQGGMGPGPGPGM